jgi:hypothetical protein
MALRGDLGEACQPLGTGLWRRGDAMPGGRR